MRENDRVFLEFAKKSQNEVECTRIYSDSVGIARRSGLNGFFTENKSYLVLACLTLISSCLHRNENAFSSNVCGASDVIAAEKVYSPKQAVPGPFWDSRAMWSDDPENRDGSNAIRPTT
jgi:hypothetical protein